MPADVQQLMLQVEASTEALRRELDRAQRDTDNFTRNTQRSATKASEAIDGIGGSAMATAKKIGAMAAGLIGLQQAGAFLIKTNMEFQKLSAMLEVATGSTRNARVAFAELEKFAAETPFTLSQVTEAYIRLKNLGLDPSIETMRSFGNTSAAMGKDIMQFIEAVADASTGEFERLKEFGIKASKEGENVKFTFQGVTTTVKNNAEAITDYLRRLGDEKFGTAMAKQAETIEGKLSNLTDTAAGLARTLGEVGFSAAFLSAIQWVTDGIAGITTQVQGLARLAKAGDWQTFFMGSGETVAQAGTSKGYAAILDNRVKVIQAERRAVENAIKADQAAGRPSGAFAAQKLARLRQDEAAAVRASADFRARNAGDFALGGFGSMVPGQLRQVPAPTSGGGGGGGGDAGARRTGAAGRAPAYSASPALLRAQGAGGEFGNFAPLMTADQAREALLNSGLLRDSLAETAQIADRISKTRLLSSASVIAAERFTETLTEGLSQALVFGRNLGDVMKAMTAEIVSSGLLSLLSGGRFGTSFGDSLSGLASIFGGFRAAGGPVEPGKAYVVGERRAEIFVPTTRGRIVPRVPEGAGGGQTEILLRHEPSPLFLTTAVQVSSSAGSRAASQQLRRAMTARLPMSRGA